MNHTVALRSPTPRRRRNALSTARGLRLEPLESRAMLSAISVLDSVIVQPSIDPLAVNNSVQGYTPAQIRAAYGFNNIKFGSITGDGAGQTIAIVDAYDDPNIANDLRLFSQTFGLSDASFKKVNQNGGTAMPSSNAGWSQEIALDVEWAHAMAPGASILLVEANSSSLSDLLTAVNYARNASGVSVVSMSWGTNEFSSEVQYDQYFTTPAGHQGVTFLASAGDSGAQALWPAISSNVVSVGGTSLNTSAGVYASETAWSGSGGGYSRYITEPSYQRTAQTSGTHSGPDVSFDANPSTGFAVYDSLAVSGRSGWFEIGGTSAGAPQWAALLAIANQGRTLSGQGTLTSASSAIYSLPSSAFHDVTAGSNGNAAKAGYDLVTGRGTPIASAVISNLVSNTTVATTGSGSTTTTNTGSSSGTTTTTTPTRHHYQLVYWNGHWYIVDVVSRAAITDGDGAQQEVAVTDHLSTGGVSMGTGAVNASSTPSASTSAQATSSDQSTSALLATAGAASRRTGNRGLQPAADSPARSIPMEQQLPEYDWSAPETGDAADTLASIASFEIEVLDTNVCDNVAAVAVDSAVDGLFADESWLAEVASPVVDASSRILARWDVDLAVAALGVALAVHGVDRCPDDRQRRVRARRPVERLVR